MRFSDLARKKSFKIAIITVVLVLLVSIVFAIVNTVGSKPSEEDVENIVTKYLNAMTNSDGDKMLELVDTTGYIIYNDVGETRFDKKYKEKDEFIEEYLKEKGYESIDDAEKKIIKIFENRYGYYDYDLKEIVSIEKSTQSKKLIIAKVRIEQESIYTTTTKTAKLYLLKVNSEYKIVGFEM